MPQPCKEWNVEQSNWGGEVVAFGVHLCSEMLGLLNVGPFHSPFLVWSQTGFLRTPEL